MPTLNLGIKTQARQAQRFCVAQIDQVLPRERHLNRLTRGLPAPRVKLACVYRQRHAKTVIDLIGGNHLNGVALWSLDEPSPQLSKWTIGSGPGTRFDLLQRCVDSLQLQEGEWLAICDDDVEMNPGSLTLLAKTGQLCGFGLLQPTHLWPGYGSYNYNYSRPFTVAREGRFIEEGPVVMAADAGRKIILPLEGNTLMGYGTDIDWAIKAVGEVRIGVVDAITMRHLVPAGAAYADGPERESLKATLQNHGMSSVLDIQTTVSAWKLWQRPGSYLRKRVLQPRG
jgi:hypothetical protein